MSEKQYIKREAVLDYIRNRAPIPANAVGAVYVDIKALPAAPVREVVRGKWVWDDDHGRYCCSKCGAASPQEDQDGEYICRPKFCHCCGADMRAEEGGAT